MLMGCGLDYCRHPAAPCVLPLSTLWRLLGLPWVYIGQRKAIWFTTRGLRFQPTTAAHVLQRKTGAYHFYSLSIKRQSPLPSTKTWRFFVMTRQSRTLWLVRNRLWQGISYHFQTWNLQETLNCYASCECCWWQELQVGSGKYLTANNLWQARSAESRWHYKGNRRSHAFWYP